MNQLVRFLAQCTIGLLASSALAAAAEVPQWSVHEIALTAALDYANPYADLELTATFTGPGGITKIVRGFWDGGRDYKVRFTPTAQGEWSYAIASTPAETGLARRGAFTTTAPRPIDHGFLRRDAAFPTTFSFDDGTRFYMLGTTYYGILDNAHVGSPWEIAITEVSRLGMNKARLFLGQGIGIPESNVPPSHPFTDPTKEQLDLEHWRAADRVVQFMAKRGMLADLIVFPYRRARDPAFLGSLEQDRRFLRYAIARYGAYPNVMWCLVNEWNYSVQPREYWNEMGRLARAQDPWSVEAGRPRALSIHQQTRPDWNFADQTWPSHAIVQSGVRNSGKRERVGDEWKPPPDGTNLFAHGDDWGNYSIVRNWTGRYPVVNDEYGYIGEPGDRSAGKGPDGGDIRLTREKHRRILWGIAVAGGYGSAGDKNDYPDGRPYDSAYWHDVPEYGDIKLLAEFFTGRGIEWWKMAPHNEIVEGGGRVYALAEPGRQYVIYAAAGGEFAIAIPPGNYAALRFDPRTGEAQPLAPVVGGRSHRLQCPDAQDWVFRLTGDVLRKASLVP